MLEAFQILYEYGRTSIKRGGDVSDQFPANEDIKGKLVHLILEVGIQIQVRLIAFWSCKYTENSNKARTSKKFYKRFLHSFWLYVRSGTPY